MGSTLARAVSYYGFKGVRLDSNGFLIGFIKTTGEDVYVEGVELAQTVTFTSAFVTAGAYITGFVIHGSGFMDIVDSTGATFTYPAHVSVPTGMLPGSYNPSYLNPDTNSIVGEFSIGTSSEGGSIFTEIVSVRKPLNEQIVFPTNGGVVGWIESRKEGWIGVILSGGSAMLFGNPAVVNVVKGHVSQHFFDSGYLLSAIDSDRTHESAKVKFSATNLAGTTKHFHTWQQRILPVHQRITLTAPAPATPIMQSLQFQTVDGANHERKDFLLLTAGFQAYAAPVSTNYNTIDLDGSSSSSSASSESPEAKVNPLFILEKRAGHLERNENKSDADSDSSSSSSSSSESILSEILHDHHHHRLEGAWAIVIASVFGAILLAAVVIILWKLFRSPRLALDRQEKRTIREEDKIDRLSDRVDRDIEVESDNRGEGVI